MVKFDLFKLHDPNIDKTSKMWISLGGKRMVEVLRSVLLNMLKYDSLTNIAKRLSKKLDMNSITSEIYLRQIKNNHFYRKRKYFVPIPIIQELLKLYSNQKYRHFKEKIINLTEKIATNSNSKPIINPKELCEDIILLAGAYAADGTLDNSKKYKGFQYRLKITEEYKDSIYFLYEIIKKRFGIYPKFKKSKYENSYILILDNKPIFRILNKLLGFNAGYKTTTITIPQTIKKLTLKDQKIFVKGFLTFDGTVDISGYLRLSIKNNDLINEIITILKKDGIKAKLEAENTREGVHSFRILIPKNRKFLDYFIQNTIKYERAKLFVLERTNKDIFELFKEKPNNKTSLKKVLKIVKNMRVFTITKLYNKTKLSHRTLRAYLRILKLANLIYEIKHKEIIKTKLTSFLGMDSFVALKLNNYFREKIFRDLMKDHSLRKIAGIIGTNEPTISNWKCGKSAININYFKKLLELSNYKEDEACSNIESLNKNLYILK